MIPPQTHAAPIRFHPNVERVVAIPVVPDTLMPEPCARIFP